MDYERSIDALQRWGRCSNDVRALVLTGSAATSAAHPLSDRDIEVFSTNIAGLMRDESWWRDLGEVLVVERLEDEESNPTLLIYYAGGKIDFTLLPAGCLDGRKYARPFQVLLDKDRVSASTIMCSRTPYHPSVAEFEESINWAWAAALMQAKAIARDEPWSAKLRDQDLKNELLRMIEWDHLARHGPGLDTRYLGTQMRHTTPYRGRRSHRE